QMPARTPHAERRFPTRLSFVLRTFPQNEVVGLFLLVLVRVDARAGLQFTPIQTRQFSVCWKLRDPVIDGSAFAVGVAGVEQLLNKTNHLRDVIRRGRD